MNLNDGLILIETTLDEVLPKAETRPAALSEAMRYAVGTGGKRIRPLISLASSVAVGGTMEDAKYAAAAIEILHNYTLIHDDLPAMDNDIERRGQPTVWKKFGEANAILAGDALLALAYKVAAKSPRQVDEIVGVLGDKGVGVVIGQVEDLSSDPRDAEKVRFIYEHKTADLFMAAAMMGALAGGGNEGEVLAVRDFALNLGLAFQYEDDLIDGDSPFDRVETERLVESTTKAALESLHGLSGDTGALSEIATMLIGRKK